MSRRSIKKPRVKIMIDGIRNPDMSDLEKMIVDEIIKKAPEIYKQERDAKRAQKEVIN